MSYSADKRLPEDFFKGVMEEKAEMLRRYLDDLGNPLIFSSYCGHTMATFIPIMIMMILSNCLILSLIW